MLSARSRLPRRTVSAVVAVLSAVAALGLGAPNPARADDVATAQERVDGLQRLAAETTGRLITGTERWEADQQALGVLELRLRNTRRHIRAAEAVAEKGQAALDQLARRAYMSPLPAASQVWLVATPETFLGAVQAGQVLDKVAGSDSEVVRRAALARHRLRQKEAEAVALAHAARQLAARSAQQMKALQALARDTANKLVAAQDALQAARARKAAAEAAARAAARAAEQRAARTRRLAASGAACTGRSTAGQQNGNLDPASLCPLWRAPGHRLRADAAAAFNAMSKHHAATVGPPLCVTDSYRSYSEQVDLYERKPGLAAVPGTSEHGWGLAVDFCGGVQDSGSAAHAWMKANAGRFGWYHPDWAKPSGSKPEAWHWEFGG